MRRLSLLLFVIMSSFAIAIIPQLSEPEQLASYSEFLKHPSSMEFEYGYRDSSSESHEAKEEKEVEEASGEQETEETERTEETEGGCARMPNRTSISPAFYQCRQGTILLLHGGALTNGTGDDSYPVSFSSRIRVFLDVTSSSNRRYDDISLEVSLQKRSTGWLGCGWLPLPTFGLLNNDAVCLDNPSCPVTTGRQVIEFFIEPPPIFIRFFLRYFHDEKTAYQFVVKLRNRRDPYREILCAAIQTRLRL